MLKRQIIPSALCEAKEIGQVYGIAEQVDEWCRKLTAEAESPQRPPTEISIDEIFELLESGSGWGHAWNKFRDAGWVEKIKAIRAVLAYRCPPWQLRVNARVFSGLDGSVLVGVETIYDINLPERTVTFVRFERFTPADPSQESSDCPLAW